MFLNFLNWCCVCFGIYHKNLSNTFTVHFTGNKPGLTMCLLNLKQVNGMCFLVGLVISMQILHRINFMISDDILKTTSVDKLPNDLEGMEASIERLLALIDDVYKYVDNVVVK